METYNSTKFVAKYTTFEVGSKTQGYVLNLDGFSSTPYFTDSFKEYSQGMKFSTKDQDQDTSSFNCADTFGGGWWYGSCFHVKLTGPHSTKHFPVASGIHWESITTLYHSFKKVSMKVRRQPHCSRLET